MKKEKKEPAKVEVPLVLEGKELLLAKFTDNWADEADFHGFRVFEVSEFEKWNSEIPKRNVTIYFGTNEENSYDTKASFLETIKVTPISLLQAAGLAELFPHTAVKCSGWDGKDFSTITTTGQIKFGYFPDFARSDWEDKEEDDD